MTKRGREVIVKEFRLMDKDEMVKALEGLGFTVKVEREEERLEDEEEELREKGIRAEVIGVFERLRAFKHLGDYCVEVEARAEADVATYSVVARRGFNIVLASKIVADPTPEQLVKAVEEVAREAEPKVKRLLEGISALSDGLKRMGFTCLATENTVEASLSLVKEGRRGPVSGVRVVGDKGGCHVFVQLLGLDYAEGVEIAKKLIKALQGLGFEVAPP
jgi:hypothetical protein